MFVSRRFDCIWDKRPNIPTLVKKEKIIQIRYNKRKNKNTETISHNTERKKARKMKWEWRYNKEEVEKKLEKDIERQTYTRNKINKKNGIIIKKIENPKEKAKNIKYYTDRLKDIFKN